MEPNDFQPSSQSLDPADDTSAHALRAEWTSAESTAEEQSLSDQTIEASQPFVGRWNQLVSTTNWEKGRIVHAWREQLVASEAPATEYSDEAWARLVGGVTGQHVGRLRRVFARFGQTYQQFEGLYWSHFQAALDWDDAELWLEGAVQNKWSVSHMRRNRWQAHDAPAELKPRDEDIVSAELDEDFEPARNSDPGALNQASHYEQTNAPPIPEGPDFGDEDPSFRADADYPSADDAEVLEIPAADEAAAIRPFAEIGTLPDDVADAFESFKLAIIRHKNAGWKDLTREEMLGVLESLKELALTPSVESEVPFAG